MPVQLDAAAVAPLEGTAAVEEITTLPRVALAVHALEADAGVRVNQAAAALLALEHRVVHRQDRRVEPPADPAPASPEEKLLRAIFGEHAQYALPFQDEHGVAELGAVIPRGTAVLYDHATRAKVLFTAEQSGEVVDVARTTEGLPEGVAERVAVTVRAAGPLAPGDVLWQGERPIGMLAAVLDDAAPEPRIYLGRAERARHGDAGTTVHVTRRLPTASQQMRGRAIGEYEAGTQQPTTGELLRPSQWRELAARGCLALFNDFAGYKCDQVYARTRAYEALVQQRSVGDPTWAPRARSSAPADAPPAGAAAGTSDVFAFFATPAANEPTREALLAAVALARACGLTLALDGHALALGLLADPTEGSHGEVADDLFSQRVFGPTRDYQCECGALARMKHRGVVCATCGVEVLNSSVRRTRFAHISLPAPVTHRWLATGWRAVPVLPAGLRADPGAPLNALYARVLAERSPAAVDALLAHLFARLREVLAGEAALRVDFSGRALALVDPRVPAGRCVVPRAVLFELARPLLYALCEELGYATTIKSSQKLVERDPALRRAFLARVFATRPVLLGSDDPARSDALAAAEVDAGDDPVVRLGPALAARLGVDSGEFVVVHLPLSEGAVREAYWLARAEPGATLREPGAALRGEGAWLRELSEAPPDAFAARLVDAARAGRVDPCAWPPAALLIGGYEIEDDAGLHDPPPPPAFEPPPPSDGRGAPPPGPPADLLDRSVDELELSVRTASALAGAQIRTLRELVQKTEAEMLKLEQFGRKSLVEIKTLLAELGLSLGTRL